ncbi:MAG TPA: hypothetical protein VFJ74_18015 [Gemmatimonadaceae bacterium]|nr:hypothetical protein [Gemmatimonadaceae bacterium]
MSRSTYNTERRGMALPVAIFAIVVVGALLAGAYFSSSQERKIGRNTLVEQRALNVAEYGLNYDVSNWDVTRNIEGNFPVGTVDANPRYVNTIGDTAFVKVTRLTPTNFLVVSNGRANIDQSMTQSTRSTSMMVQIAYPTVTTKAAMMSGGFVDLNGSGSISGFDQDPINQGTDCDSYTDENLASIVVPPLPKNMKTNISIGSGADSSASPPPGGVGSAKGIYGASPIAYSDSAAIKDSTYRVYGSESWTSLKDAAVWLAQSGDVNMPTIQPSLNATNGCDTRDIANWGQIDHTVTTLDKFAPCKSYYPILYAPADLYINNGTGQGILLVEGSLHLGGNFTFDGLIIVHNDLQKGNGTVELHGSVMVQDYKIECSVRNAGSGNCNDGTDVSGTFDLRYSKCAVQNALRGSAVLVPVKQRAWAQLY